jgi:soluble lytic murein transglycosylase-like protein
MMRQKLIILVMLMLPISISAQEGKFDWNPVMDAIIQVESKGNPKAHNKNGDCAGILQITPGLVKQCNTWLKAKKSKKRYTLSDRYNVKKSKEMFVMVQKHYNKSNNVEKAIRVWNGGPGYTLEGTNGYYRKVMKYYNKKGAD